MDRTEQLSMLEAEWKRRGRPWCCEYCGQPLHKIAESPTGVSFPIGDRKYSTGKSHPVPEHVVSRGPTTLENLVPACQTCNQYKGPKSVEVYRTELNEFKQRYREDWDRLHAIWDSISLQQQAENQEQARFEAAFNQPGVKLIARNNQPVQFTKKQLKDLDRDFIRPNSGILYQFTTARRDWWRIVIRFPSRKGAAIVHEYLTKWNDEWRTARPDTQIPFDIIE